SNDAANPFKVAMPIRSPVKLPGPEAQAKSSTSANVSFASAKISLMSFNKLAHCETFGSPERAANSVVPRPSQTLPPSVAVSRLKIIGVFKSVLRRRRQIEQQPPGARNQVCQLIR